MKITLQITDSIQFIHIPQLIPFQKARVSKFKFIHNNIDIKSIILIISEISSNVFHDTGNKYIEYFFCVPYIENTNAFYNSTNESWDYITCLPNKINQFDIRLVDENNQAIPLVAPYDIQLELEFI